MAGGAQLKKLKESLKNAGLTGQSNFGKKGKKGKKNGAQDKLRKDDRERALKEIREQFNPFDMKVNKNKRADALEKKQTVGKPGISKQVGEENRRKEFNAKMERKGKAGGIVDRRFGEGNVKLSHEEKMLERYTRERLAKSSKSSMYNLEDDDNIDYEDDNELGLTHLGQSLSNKPSSGDQIEEDDDFFSKKRSTEDAAEEEPARKKTKAEVMKEVIAKSKKFKHERQKAHLENMEAVQDLDQNFDNVMDEISKVNRTVTEPEATKSKFDIDYDMKVTEAKLDRRAAPTDRTKTEEELQKEAEEKRLENERKRQLRMEGDVDENGEEIDRPDGVAGDDLDDDFWAGSGDEENGFTVKSPVGSDEEDEEEGEEDEGSEDNDEDEDEKKDSKPKETIITIGKKKIVIKPKVTSTKLVCPKTLLEFQKIIPDSSNYDEVVELIKKVFETYQPKLSEGNKEKLGIFTTVLFDYLLVISNNEHNHENKSYTRLMNFLTRSICNLSEKYQDLMLEKFRNSIMDVHERLLSKDKSQFPLQQDTILLTLIGRTFSTSDKFHLVVIPAILVACESLEFMDPQNEKTDLFFGIFLCDVLLRYENVSERVIPEVISFVHKVLLSLAPNPEDIEDWKYIISCSTPPKPTAFTMSSPLTLNFENEEDPISISKMFEMCRDETKTEHFLQKMLIRMIKTLDTLLTKMIKNTLAAPELTRSFIPILRHLIKHTNSNPKIVNLITKFSNINKISNNERRPLKLQNHRAVGIQTISPRFYENFNPDRKTQKSAHSLDPLDPIAVQDEINKLKYQIKEERKQTLKDIRRDTKFEARAQISKKKQDYDEYHSKMARIYNSIQTEEGAAKNEYEREKKKLKNRK